MQFNLLDIIIFIIFALSIIVGFRRGFIKAITKFTITIISIFLGIRFYDDCLLVLKQYFNIGDYLSEIINKKWAIPTTSAETTWFKYLMPLEKLYFPSVTDNLIQALEVLIGFALVFFLSAWLLNTLARLLDGLFAWGILAWINAILGMVFITLKNTLVFMLLLILLSPILELTSIIGLPHALFFNEMVNGSLLINYLFILLESANVVV